MSDSQPASTRYQRLPKRSGIIRAITTAFALALFHPAIAQPTDNNINDDHHLMMDAFLSEGPNSAPVMRFRIVGFAAQDTGGDFSIPVRIAEKQCTSAKCEISSRLDGSTEILDGEGETVAAQSLEKHRDHQAISIRFDDRGPGLVEQIILMPQRTPGNK